MIRSRRRVHPAESGIYLTPQRPPAMLSAGARRRQSFILSWPIAVHILGHVTRGARNWGQIQRRWKVVSSLWRRILRGLDRVSGRKIRWGIEHQKAIRRGTGHRRQKRRMLGGRQQRRWYRARSWIWETATPLLQAGAATRAVASQARDS